MDTAGALARREKEQALVQATCAWAEYDWDKLPNDSDTLDEHLRRAYREYKSALARLEGE